MDLIYKESHGFYLNKQMKWTFKSHEGFFVPVIYNNKIQGLRIHLDKEYKLKTTDIWFSSSKEYRGSNAKNSILLLIPKDIEKLELVTKENEGKEIIIASEMLLAYKAYKEWNKITIGLPNTISAKEAERILSNIKIKQANVYFDFHTVFTDPSPIYRNLLDKIDEDKINIKFIIKNSDMEKLDNENVAKVA